MLNWPEEGIRCGATPATWSLAGSNLVLDFHGDPLAAGLCIFSDGNHHMALEESLQRFRDAYPAVGGIFYATTPPDPILILLRHGRLKIGNFVLSATVSNRKVFFGQSIHHREAPEAVAAATVDAAIVYYHLALRCVRIFSEIFEMVSIGGGGHAPAPGNLIGFTHAGLIGDGGTWGRMCLDFLFTRPVADIYRAHGLDPLFVTETQRWCDCRNRQK